MIQWITFYGVWKRWSAGLFGNFAKSFPEEYETVVGERGTRLSGGEKQRIAIARAFLTNPNILILDDSMSAIDSETEEKIGKAIANILKNRTTIIITHRLHTIKYSDLILVMKEGRIVAQGDHQTLIRSSSEYQRSSAASTALSA